MEVIDLSKNEKIVFFDGSAIQNEPNSSKSISKKGNKNLTKKNPYKFKVNALGSIIIGNSTLTISKTSKAHEIARAFIDIKIANTEIHALKSLLNKVLLDSDLSPNQIQQKSYPQHLYCKIYPNQNLLLITHSILNDTTNNPKSIQ